MADYQPPNAYYTGQMVNPATGEFIVSSAFSPEFGWVNLTNLGGTYSGGGGQVGIDQANFGGSYLGYAGTTADPNAERAANGDFSHGNIGVDASGSFAEQNNAGSLYYFSAPWTPPTPWQPPPPPAPLSTPPGPPPISTNPADAFNPNDPAHASATAIINGVLSTYDLSGLSQWASAELKAGSPQEQVLLDLYQRPEFKARFAGNDLLAKAGLQPLAPDQYLAAEQALSQTFANANLPSSFLSRDYLAQVIGSGLSPAAAASRVNNAFAHVDTAPQAVKDQFAAYFGASGRSALAALALEPDMAEAELSQKIRAAEVGAEANRFGVGFDVNRATDLAARGVTDGQIDTALSKVRTLDPLYAQTVGEGTSGVAAVDRNTAIAAALDQDPDAQRQVQSALDARVAAGAGGTRYAESARGIEGAGTV